MASPIPRGALKKGSARGGGSAGGALASGSAKFPAEDLPATKNFPKCPPNLTKLKTESRRLQQIGSNLVLLLAAVFRNCSSVALRFRVDAYRDVHVFAPFLTAFVR